MKTLQYSSQAAKFLKALDSPLKLRFKNKLEALAKNEVQGILLHKPLQNYQKVRVGNYRIIFEAKPDHILYVLKVQHRSKIYKS